MRRGTPGQRDRAARRGRAAVTVMVVGWAVVQFGLSRAADVEPSLRDPGYSHRVARFRGRVLDRASDGGRSLTLAFVGSSRVAYGVSGRVVEDALCRRVGRPAVVFNFGAPAAGPVTNLVTVHR